jgi:hypothetical protein
LGYTGLACEVSTFNMTCSYHGVFRDGICICEEGWRGTFCEEKLPEEIKCTVRKNIFIFFLFLLIAILKKKKKSYFLFKKKNFLEFLNMLHFNLKSFLK